MKKVLALTALVAISGSALAADVGLGVSIHSGDPTIYVPIDIGEKFRIEPLLRYQSRKSEQLLSAPSSSYKLTGTAKTTSLAIGSGFFGVAALADSATVYYGARIAYLTNKLDVSYSVSGVGGPPPDPSPTKEKLDGFLLAPTLGLKYRFSDHFAVAGEAALEYSKVDGDGNEESGTRTTTNIVFRYRF